MIGQTVIYRVDLSKFTAGQGGEKLCELMVALQVEVVC